MADKFAITAELQLLLDSKIDSDIEALRKKIEKSGAAIPVTINASIKQELDKVNREFQKKKLNLNVGVGEQSLRNLYKELNLIFNSADRSRRRIGLKVDLDDDSLRSFYKKLNVIFDTSAKSKRRIKLGVALDENSLRQLYNEINTVFDSARGSKRRINISAGVNEASIKRVYEEFRAIYNSFKKPINLSVNLNQNNEILTLKSAIDSLQSRVIKIDVKLRKDIGVNIASLSTALMDLDQKVAAFNVGNLDRIANGLSVLSSLGKRKLSFDLSIKDANAAQVLADNVNKIAAAFNRASIAGGNFKTVLSQILGQIGSIKSSASGLQFNNFSKLAKNINKLGNQSKSINRLNNSIKNANDSLFDLGVQSALTVKRFAAYTLVTAGFFRLSFAVRNAVNEFIEFDKQLTTIRQVTKDSIASTALLGDEVTKLATRYGVSSKVILEQSQVLAQAGFNARDTAIALEALSKAAVAPTFEDINDTTEATIALLAQFGGDVNNLEANLSSINAVAAAFAVEADDITTAIQKAGGGFAAAGGDLNEFLALFTSVRSTTRESADTIATGFRTIFTRLQRPRTAKFLEDFGVSVRKTSEDVATLGGNVGDFVGPFEAIARISEATSQLSSADPRFAQIVEELGGFRQINKVIPLLQQYGKAQEALRIAESNRNSLTEDSIIAQESYANKIEKVKQEFLSFIRSVASNETIKDLIDLFLGAARAALQLAQALKGLTPLIAAFGAFKAGTGILPVLAGFRSKFNTGGMVPGGGPDRDTVPALLTSGEFVMRRSAVNFYGQPFMNAINNKKILDKKILFSNSGGPVGYNNGGFVGYRSGGIINAGTTAAIAGASLLGPSGIGALVGGFADIEDDAKTLALELGAAALAATFFYKQLTSQSIGELFKPNKGKPLFVPSEDNEKFVRPSKPRRIIKKEDSLPVVSLTTAEEIGRQRKDFRDEQIRIQKEKKEPLGQNLLARTFKDLKTDRVSGAVSNKDLAIIRKQLALNNQNLQSLEDQTKQLEQQKKRRVQLAQSQQSAIAGSLRTREKELQRIIDFRDDPSRTPEEREGIASFEKQKRDQIAQLREDQRRYDPQAIGARYDRRIDRTRSRQRDIIAEDNSLRQRVIGERNRRIRLASTNLTNADFAGAESLGRREGNIARLEREQFAANTSNYARNRGFVFGTPEVINQRREAARQEANRGVVGDLRAFFGGGTRNPSGPNRPPPNTPKIKDLFKSANSSARFAQVTGAAGVAAGIFGTTLGQSVLSRSLKGENRKGDALGAQLGGAITGASQFGAAGAAIGSFAGPAGAAIGGAVGALIGGVKGAADGLKEFEKSVEIFNASDSLQKLSDTFERIAKGNSPVENNLVDFNVNVSSLRNSVVGTTNESTREDIVAGIRNNNSNINSFITGVAESTSTIDEFDRKIDSSTQLFLAGVLKIPFDKFRQSIEKTIKTNNDQTNLTSKLNDSIQTFDASVRSARSFNIAFEKASLSVNNFANNLESFITGGLGSTDVVSSLPQRLSNLDLLDNRTANDASNFLSQFGDPGRILSEQTSDTAKILQSLPGILLDLRAESPFSEQGDLESRLQSRLSSLNLNSSQGIDLVTSRFSELLGEDFKDSNFFKALQKDFPKALSDLTAGLSDVPNILAEAANKSLEELNKFASGLAQATAVGEQIFQGQLKTFDNRGSLIQSRAAFSGRDQSAALFANAQNRQNFVTGGRGINELGRDILNSRARIQALSEPINTGRATRDQLVNLGINQPDQALAQGQLAVQQALLTARNQEQESLQRSTRALNFLANSTEKLSILQGKLNSLQSERAGRRSVAERFVSGDAAERSRILRIQQQAQLAARLGTVSGFSGEDRSAILSFLKEVDTQENRDALTKILQNDAIPLGREFAASGQPSKEEEGIQKQIEAQIAEQQKAQQTLNQILINQRQQFLTALDQNFKNFLSNLQSTISNNQGRELTQSRNRLDAQRNVLSNQLTTKQNLESRFGVGAAENFKDAKTIQEKLTRVNELQPLLANAQVKAARADDEFLKTQAVGDALTFQTIGGKVPIAEFERLRDQSLSDLPEDQRNNVLANLSAQSLGQKGGFVDFGKAFSALESAVASVNQGVQNEQRSLRTERNRVIENLGFDAGDKDTPADPNGIKAFEALARANIDISRVSNQTQEELRKQIEKLSVEIASYNKLINSNARNNPVRNAPAKFNSGGYVPGVGTSDTVPALLTPGEFVFNRSAVKNIGVQTLQKANSGARKFQDGGLVQSSNSIINMEGIDAFRRAVNSLGSKLNSLQETFTAIPSEITMTGRHTLDVNINGAQAFAAMQESFKMFVQAQITNSINQMLKNKFPEAGTFDG